MMKATDLRIGNAVKETLFGREGFIKSFTPTSALIKLPVSQMRTHLTNITPIPITEEWLKKLGFEKKSSKWGIMIDFKPCWAKYSFCISIWEDGKLMYDWIGGNIEIKYVHQLQNIYYSLLGRELVLAVTPKENTK